MGRVWSIIEPEVLGFIRIYKNEIVPGKLLPGFRATFSKEYESKVMCIEFIEKNRKMLYGFHDGQISYFDYYEKNLEKPQTKSVVFSNECILFMKHLFENKVLIVLPTAIKILHSNYFDLFINNNIKNYKS